ncbi:hypothetical protein RFM41_33550 [Mesorhizobium sp. VK25A]|uniref:Integrase catalytic domain-containing protein n=1 Tax=Mesorhizobium vachelliae TaxID=3072309 RepID=A0ABU5AF54_9HYPH|nr:MULTISPECIES: hypothetical protein [unclassified Mesorhizobium]MDX8535915.1 hypothetical protein [Mesorhizobium sp. VK25D]MDX8548659.1 hypothetical protein [Mesorhizobium sp. VK25A]
MTYAFMKQLKQEEVQGLAYKDADDARRRIGAFIETVYNTRSACLRRSIISRRGTHQAGI